jgi:histidyl-tRNA synthetase
MDPLRAPKGMNDVLPGDVAAWHRVEGLYARTMRLHGYREMRTPHLESTSLFVRAVGETTDIVEKEMFSFQHHDDKLTLRPEGTAGIARAFVEHGLHAREPVSRIYYVGPMYRAERPQRGRYREFYQAGAEVFGDPGPACDAEMIAMLVGFLSELGIKDARVHLGSIGSTGTRAKYKEALLAYLEPHRAALSEDSQRRMGTNPLRILDSKNPKDREVVKDAPSILDLLDEADQAHFDGLRRLLDALGTPYTVDRTLVRGLDYYTRTLFEIKGASDKLGAGDTLLGGGRYDGMIGELGGAATPAIGYAAGIERLIIASDPAPAGPIVDAFVAPLGARALEEGLRLARELRAKGIPCEVDGRGGSLKSLLRRGNGLGARVVLILGDGELDKKVVTVKDMAGHAQEEIARDAVVGVVVDRLAAAAGVREEGT